MYNVIIAGSRNFNDYEMLARTVDEFLAGRQDKVTIFCGKARGADTLGERYASERGYAIRYFPADWRRYGRGAGCVRNEEMAKSADALLAFWDGSSRGTGSMIEAARKHNIVLRVLHYKERGDRA